MTTKISQQPAFQPVTIEITDSHALTLLLLGAQTLASRRGAVGEYYTRLVRALTPLVTQGQTTTFGTNIEVVTP